MKKIVIIFFVLCAAVAVPVVYLNKKKSPPTAPTPVAESAPSQSAEPALEKIAAPKTELPSATPATGEPVKVVTAIPIASETQLDNSTNPVHKLVDGLLSAKNGAQKHALFEQLAKSGQLDAAIAELKQRAADNPNDPELPTTLGEAQLNKLRAISAAGGDQNEVGILAMQADQSFNAALKIDPQNWEAQFVKASALAGWPVELNKGPEVIQQLSSLIDQQETMTSQPEFAQTYVVLGNEYQKIGQPDKAEATWRLGLEKFPNNSALQKKINGP